MIAVSGSAAIAQELPKEGILKELRAGHAEIRKQLENCVIEATRRQARKPDEKIDIRYFSRGDKMRCDEIRSFAARTSVPDSPETLAVVASPVQSFTVVRMSPAAPFVLTNTQGDVESRKRDISIVGKVGQAPYALFGSTIESILAHADVKIVADEHPDPDQPSWRRVSIVGGRTPNASDANGAFTFDESWHWALVKYDYGRPKERWFANLTYSDNADQRVRLKRLEILRQIEDKPPFLTATYEVTSISFEPPDESLFTLEHFGITLDEGSYLAWYMWLVGGGLLLFALGYLGRRMYRRYEAA